MPVLLAASSEPPVGAAARDPAVLPWRASPAAMLGSPLGYCQCLLRQLRMPAAAGRG